MQGYRWLLGREPESEEVVLRHLTATGGDWARLRAHIMRSREFRSLAASSIAGQAVAPAELSTTPGGLISLDDVTVCMIVHNEEEFIERSLRPLTQVFPSFVIADMESSDHTVSIIKDVLGAKATILAYERQKLVKAGYSVARNYCASYAKSRWILMLDADEVLIAGADKIGIRIDRSLSESNLISVERRNLSKPGALLPEGVKPTERPRRLYRNDGSAHWTGYIHEELAISSRSEDRKLANSSLVFEHLSALRTETRDRQKRAMYRWMLLHAYQNPQLRGGTNKWWYEKFVPENIEMIRASARQFEEHRRTAPDFEKCARGTAGSVKTVRSRGPRETVIHKLWRGIDPFAEPAQNLPEPDLQGWNSNHTYLSDAIRIQKPEIVVEVGVWKGASVLAMAKEMRDQDLNGVVIAVDTWLGGWDHWCQEQWHDHLCFRQGYPQLYYKFIANVVTAGVEKFVVPLPLDSGNAAFVLRKLEVVADAIHLDAAHDYDSVARDLRTWWPALRSGGLFIGDDYFSDGETWPEVRRAVDEFLGLTPHAKFEHQHGKFRAIKV